MDKERERTFYRQNTFFLSMEEAHNNKEGNEVPVEVRTGVFQLMNREELKKWLEMVTE